MVKIVHNSISTDIEIFHIALNLLQQTGSPLAYAFSTLGVNGENLGIGAQLHTIVEILVEWNGKMLRIFS